MNEGTGAMRYGKSDAEVQGGEAESTLIPTLRPNATAHTSVMLQRLRDEAPPDHFTLGWVMVRLSKRSFGMVMLLLALVALAPGISIVAGLLLMILAFQMIAGRSAPTFPRRLTTRPIPTQRLARLVQRAVPVLRVIEKVIHPRWGTPLEITKRLVGTIVLILSAILVLTPIPLSNVVPALVIALIALAYLEEDGALLVTALTAAVIVVIIAVAAAWETAIGAKWIGGLW